MTVADRQTLFVPALPSDSSHCSVKMAAMLYDVCLDEHRSVGVYTWSFALPNKNGGAYGAQKAQVPGTTAEYPLGTRKSLLPADTPVRDDVRPKDDGKEENNTESQFTEKGQREIESAMEEAEKEFEEHTQLELDGMKEQTRGGATEITMDPDYRDDEDRPGEREGG
ncbi:hypothetical protein NDU88_002525 [Pleurodeles waltl]|uniref:Uncharacterized protein n=1 Tax=Pleurodeles waltl TaxID=8319 RepID=A0AAV7M1U9_PLEWA|nr:hypothetical protein NDU88_002525 [Pleurodeles waltl]